MELKIKNLNILGGSSKNLIFRGLGPEKPIYRRELSKKGGLDSLQIEGGAWQKREGGVFEGVGGQAALIPQHTLCEPVMQHLADGFWQPKCVYGRVKFPKYVFGCPTGRATSSKANLGNYSRYSLIKWYQFLSVP